MNNETFWFRHDSNAKDDAKIMLMIEDLGLEAYGIYWILIETLTEQQNLEYFFKFLSPLSKKYS